VKRPALTWIFLLLLTACFTLATGLQSRVDQWSPPADASGGGMLKLWLGESRRVFASHFFEKADVYFHSGYYPSIFDAQRAPQDTRHMTSKEGSAEAEAHEASMNFLGPPRDWIERFGRQFMVTEHTHLEGGNEREILPWLRISADLDPHRVDTYTVAAFWLRDSLGKPREAEQFLREGLRNNPTSYELWLELGMLYQENLHDMLRARNALELALRYWQEQEPNKADPDRIGFEKIVIRLARIEEQQNHLSRAIDYLKMAVQTSPNPDVVRKQITDLEQKLASGHGSGAGGGQ
jgi:tetratricopeptide (TPR) repeat protein